MAFERWTDRARRVIVLAEEEARQLGHNHISTEHLLLGLLRERGGVAAQALQSFDVDLAFMRAYIEDRVGANEISTEGHIPFTRRADKVFQLALREALQLGHDYIGTEHVLLALIREGEGVAAAVLVRDCGLDLRAVRHKVIEILSGESNTAPLNPVVVRGTVSAADSFTVKSAEECLSDLVPSWTARHERNLVEVNTGGISFMKTFGDDIRSWTGESTDDAASQAAEAIERALRLSDLAMLIGGAKGMIETKPVLVGEVPIVDDLARTTLQVISGRALEEAHRLGYHGFDE